MSINHMVTMDDVHDVHTYLEHSLARLHRVEPDEDAQKKYFKRNPAAWYKAKNETVAMGQKIKKDGDGNTAAKALTINIMNLGIVDRQKVLLEEFEKLNAVGKKMGYVPADVREAEVVPETKGKNRMDE